MNFSKFWMIYLGCAGLAGFLVASALWDLFGFPVLGELRVICGLMFFGWSGMFLWSFARQY